MADNDAGTVLESKAAPEVQEEAKGLGWIPPDRYEGDPEKYIDADEYVRRGKEIMPILRQNNARLSQEAKALRAEVAELKALHAEGQESIKSLQEFHSKETQRRLKETREGLLRELKEAKKDGDIDGEVEIQDQLSRLNTVEAPGGNATTGDSSADKAKPDLAGPKVSPEVQAQWDSWRAKNTWFGQDERRSRMTILVMQELRAKGEASVGDAFMDKVVAEVDRTLGGNTRRNGTDKVEGSRNTGGGTRAARGFADLPQDAKDACHSFNNRLVGPKKQYKTVGDWEKAYYDTYYSGDQR